MVPQEAVNLIVISLVMGGAGTSHVRPPLDGPRGFVYQAAVVMILDRLAYEIAGPRS